MQNILFSSTKIISFFGSEVFVFMFIFILFLIILFWKKEKNLAKFILYNYSTTIIIVIILKYITHKERNPFALVYENSYAFPSGHIALAMITSLIIFYLSKFIKSKLNILLKIFAIIWPLLTIFARLYLKVHDIHDATASIAIASFIFLIYINKEAFNEKLLKKDMINLK